MKILSRNIIPKNLKFLRERERKRGRKRERRKKLFGFHYSLNSSI